jgi:hypothetical protein
MSRGTIARHLEGDVMQKKSALWVAVAGISLVCLAALLSGVAWAVTENAFRYSSPKTGWYGMNPMAFSSSDSRPGFHEYFIQWPDYLRNLGSGTHCFSTGVNLPQGARMTRLSAWYSTDAAGSVRVSLFRAGFADDSFSGLLAQLNSTDTSSTRAGMSAEPGIPEVQNAQFNYAVGVCMDKDSDRFYGARISYTYTTAGD